LFCTPTLTFNSHTCSHFSLTATHSFTRREIERERERERGRERERESRYKVQVEIAKKGNAYIEYSLPVVHGYWVKTIFFFWVKS
jgi:hypothetical protein